MEAEHIKKSHNKSLLMYHIVCPVKYRRKVFTKEVELTLKNICVGIAQRYEIYFIEIGADNDHVHFLIQSIPTFTPTKLVNTIKGITAREIFKLHKNIKKDILWGGHFWTSGYYINTVGKFSNEAMMRNYVKNQGVPKQRQKEYKQIYYNSEQSSLF